MDYKDIIYSKEGGIATITMNRPDRMNSFSPEMTESLYQAITDAGKDEEVRVLVITGTGRVFCAGADVKAMANRANKPKGGGGEDESEGSNSRLCLLLQKLDKPVIAAVNGVAAGGGFDLACACDIRIASEKATFAEVFIRRGLIPAMGATYFLPRLVGLDRACYLIWTGDMVEAKEAERMGLVTMVVPHEELESATMELADKLANGPPLAIQKAKRAIYEGLGMDLESTLDYVAVSVKELRKTEDHKEGARAFVQKREPVFKGK
ncbi:enoyl-CoA hydratase/isomerase family protein [Chloroflexota bacterium]